MVTYCVAFGCKNKFNRDNPDIRFHRFPLSKKELCKKWILAVRRANWIPSISSRICNQHFLESDYKPKYIDGRWELKEDAVPSVFNFSPHIKKVSARKEALLIRLSVPQKKGKCSVNSETDNPPETKESDYRVTTESNELEHSDTNTTETVYNLSESESLSDVPSIQEEINNLSDTEELDHFVLEENNELEYSDIYEEETCHQSLLFEIESSSEVPSVPQTVINNVTLVDVECQTEDYVQPSRIIDLKRKIKTLQQKVRRQESQISRMKLLIKNFKSESHTTKKVTDVPSNYFSGRPLMVVISGGSTFTGSDTKTS